MFAPGRGWSGEFTALGPAGRARPSRNATVRVARCQRRCQLDVRGLSTGDACRTLHVSTANNSVMSLTLEQDEVATVQLCKGCGRSHRTVRGYHYKDGAAWVTCWASLYERGEHRPHPVAGLTLALAEDWSDDGDRTNRLWVQLEAWPHDDQRCSWGSLSHVPARWRHATSASCSAAPPRLSVPPTVAARRGRPHRLSR